MEPRGLLIWLAVAGIGLGAQLSVFGHKNGSFLMDRYRRAFDMYFWGTAQR